MIRILHLEDDHDILEISEMALALSGEFEIMQCTNGEDAIARAEGFKPDVLLLDVMLPGMRGPAVLQILRKMPGLENVPAIFLTARAMHSETDDLHDQGAVLVISKPFDPMTLGNQILAAIREVGADRRKSDQHSAGCDS